MTQINRKQTFEAPSTNHPSSANASHKPSAQNHAAQDKFAAGGGNPGAKQGDPYAHVDWKHVNYDFRGVDWKSLNYHVGSQAQTAEKSAPHKTAPAQASGIVDTGASTKSKSKSGVKAKGKVDTDTSSKTSSKSGAKASSKTSGSAAKKSSTAAASASAKNGKATGPGVWLTNASTTKQTYSFYNNASNGNGFANPTYTDPTASVSLAPGESKFVPLSADFKGRVQKTDGDAKENTWATASTWAEFQLSASNDGAAHGDISYQTGFDGAATIASTDGSNQVGGTTENLLKGAPANILAKSATGATAIANNSNAAATAYLQAHVDESKAYTGFAGTGTNDVASKNNQLAVTFY